MHSLISHLAGKVLNTYTAINLKSSIFTTEEGGGFVKGPLTFMITDGLDIKVLKSGAQAISLMRSLNDPFNDIEAMTVSIGEPEVIFAISFSNITWVLFLMNSA